MRNAYIHPILILLLTFAFLVGCTKEDESVVPNPASTFDQTQVAEKTFRIGERLQYSIGFTPNRPMKEMVITMRTLKAGTWTSTTYQTVQLNDSDQPFDYNFDLTLAEQHRGLEKMSFEFMFYFSQPEESGRAAASPLTFFFFVAQ